MEMILGLVVFAMIIAFTGQSTNGNATRNGQSNRRANKRLLGQTSNFKREKEETEEGKNQGGFFDSIVAVVLIVIIMLAVCAK